MIFSANVQPNLQAKTNISPSTSSQTIQPDSGYYGLSSVQINAMPSGTEGTPTATKGTVSNHSVSVTPSVTNTAGYITGSTKTGTAVTVSASELVSGTKSITANGTAIDVTNYAAVDVAVSGGGGGDGDMSDPIRFFDYDGTLVASYSSVPSSLPSVPTHDGLTSGTWNYTLQQLTTQFNAVGACDVGANYSTTSGKTEIDVSLEKGRLAPYIQCAPNGTVTVNWGDGTSTSTLAGTSLTTRQTVQHTYAQPGEYTITLTPATGTTYALYGTSSYTLLNKNNSSITNNRAYSNCVKSIRLGASCSIGQYAFMYCSSLESVSIPSSVTAIGNYAFQYCFSLRYVTIPSGVTTIGTYAFQFCYGLVTLSMPSSVTGIGNYAFNNCYAIQSIAMPNSITSLGNYSFNSCFSMASVAMSNSITATGTTTFAYCYCLISITIPSTVTSLGNGMLNYCSGLGEIHFKSSSPPTCSNSNVWTGIQSDCKIYVPTGKLSAYTSANNYPSSSTYTYVEE